MLACLLYCDVILSNVFDSGFRFRSPIVDDWDFGQGRTVHEIVDERVIDLNKYPGGAKL